MGCGLRPHFYFFKGKGYAFICLEKSLQGYKQNVDLSCLGASQTGCGKWGAPEPWDWGWGGRRGGLLGRCLHTKPIHLHLLAKCSFHSLGH